ncbi:MAG: response regulator transcription factor [Cryobacterium sp.]|nr:response regulator transcription factor [Micrococcales bacterium]MBX3308983.1 response regulator transcription factor [Cryobacterium sp.]
MSSSTRPHDSAHQDPLATGVRVLVVEDDPSISRLVVSYLEREGFVVDVAGDGTTGVDLTRSLRPDVVVLDLMLPGMDGIEVCRRIRTFSDAYVVMLTARIEEIDRLIGLSVGADDYIGKPFSPRELVARIRAMLRRPRTEEPGMETIRPFGALKIDPVAREVQLDSKLLELTRTEFDLLEVLSSHPRRVFARRLLLEEVWGGDWFGDDHVVEVHVANLRRKLGDDPRTPRYIRTVRGVGYRMGMG